MANMYRYLQICGFLLCNVSSCTPGSQGPISQHNFSLKLNIGYCAVIGCLNHSTRLVGQSGEYDIKFSFNIVLGGHLSALGNPG